MSIASEISRLQTAKAGLKTAIEGKGVTVSDTATLDAYPALVESIQTGGSGGSDADLIGVIERSGTSVNIPNGCTKIGDYAFYRMTNAYQLTNGIPDTVTYIGNYAFYYLEYLGRFGSISLPDSITYIGDYAFAECYNLRLKSSSLPSSLTYIGEYAFAEMNGNYNYNLAIDTIPANVKTISRGVFIGCYGIKSLTFKGTPTTINAKAFSTCNNLTTINVPWASGAVKNAPWGATDATINYNYTGA